MTNKKEEINNNKAKVKTQLMNKKYEKLHDLTIQKQKIKESFKSNLENNSSTAVQKTTNLIDQASTNVTLKAQELQALQTKFNDILKKYEDSNTNLINASQNYIQSDSFNKSKNPNINNNIFVSQVLSTEPTEKYIGCYNDTSDRAMNSGSYNASYEKCKTDAVNGGYKYFGLQYPIGDDLATCFFSNDLSTTTKYGIGQNINALPIWNTATDGKGAVKAVLDKTGNLILYDANNNVVEPVSRSPQPGGVPNKNGPSDCIWSGSINLDSVSATYGGNCHVSNGNVTSKVKSIIGDSNLSYVTLDNTDYYGNDITNIDGLNTNQCLDKCTNDPNCKVATIIKSNGMCYLKNANALTQNHAPNNDRITYVQQTMQNNNPTAAYTTGTAIIPVSNDTFGDPAVGCAKSFDIAYQCGNINQTKHLDYAEGQNVLLDCSSQFNSCNFFISLQGDGNFCIYRGTPEDNKGAVWCAMTNGQQKQPNPDYVASKNKFGRSYMKSGEYLKTDEWLSSDDGSLVLIMQGDGNLVLYTYEYSTKCVTQSNGKEYGGIWANSVYELSQVGNLSNLNKVGYIDDNSNLYEYPSSMVTRDSNNNVVINNDNSCNKNVVNVDTLQWNNYKLSPTQMSPTTTCGLTRATKPQQDEVESLRKQLVDIANQIVEKIIYFESLNVNMINQMGIDKNVLDSNLKKYKELGKKFGVLNGSDMSNVNEIIEDSKINVSNGNFNYTFWGILAIIIILITIKILRY